MSGGKLFGKKDQQPSLFFSNRPGLFLVKEDESKV
jgi:hypothetical protein